MTIHAAEFSEQILERDGCAIHYWLGGVPDHPLVVLTHGAGIDHHEWDTTVAALATDFRVLTWDVRAHGTSRPNTSPFTIRLATDDLIALLDHLHAGSALLVGHSMGGNMTQEVIFRYPDRVRAAVLFGCANNMGHLTTFERLEIGASGPLFAFYPTNALYRQSANVSSDNADVRAYLYAAMSRMPKDEFITVLLALLRNLHEEPDYHIPLPFLLTHGIHDKTGNIRRMAPQWARDEPNSEYR